MKATKITILALLILTLGLWTWTHFARSSLLVFFAGSHVRFLISDGSLEFHPVIGMPDSLQSAADFEILADTGPYSRNEDDEFFTHDELETLDSPDAPLPDRLFENDPIDPFTSSDFTDYPFPNSRPSIGETLRGRSPLFTSSRGGGFFQFILSVPFHFIIGMLTAALAVTSWLLRSARTPNP